MDTPSTLRRKSLLLVDDDPGILEALGELLREEGLEVHTATNGMEALELLQRVEDPGLIILDLMMPRMDGLTFLEKAALGNCAVVVISADVSLDKARRYPAVVGTLRKPFEFEELFAVIDRHCPAAASRHT